MAHALSDHDLALAQDCLMKALAELEKACEFAAAAHVASAIELVEQQTERVIPSLSESRPVQPVTVLAGGMRDAFGESAESVARRQLMYATGPTLLAWAAIINQITASAF